MDPKKALMKGLRGISRDEFMEAAKLFAKEGVKENSSSYATWSAPTNGGSKRMLRLIA